jgi:hypothetical protein
MPGDVEGWLLEGDPAIRWQTMRDLVDAPERTVTRERGRVAKEGWGARLLGLRGTGGIWTGYYSPKWTSATYTLQLLRACGLQAGNRAAGAAALALLDAGLYRDDGINFWKSLRRSEACVTAMILATAARYAPGDPRIERLACYMLREQMPDGGWNCERPTGATHSSLHTTISALEGLLEYEACGGAQREKTRAARERGHEFLFTHCLFRSHRTGAIIDERMMRFSFPPQWHYDVLRGLDYLAAAGAARDERASDAVELVRRRRLTDGKWPLQNVYSGKYFFRMERAGEASRWNTLRALRVLRWWEK